MKHCVMNGTGEYFTGQKWVKKLDKSCLTTQMSEAQKWLQHASKLENGCAIIRVSGKELKAGPRFSTGEKVSMKTNWSQKLSGEIPVEILKVMEQEELEEHLQGSDKYYYQVAPAQGSFAGNCSLLVPEFLLKC